MIKKEKLVYMDLFVSFSSLFLFLFFSPDISILISVIFLIVYLILTKRNFLFYHFILSFLISLSWMIFARKEYSYNIDGLYVFGIRIFTLFSWTLGLFIVYLIYSHFNYIVKKKNVFVKISFFTLFYIPLLLFVETIGYHIFNIKNFEGTYSGLPLFDCMHAVWWMKIAYFMLGIVYISLCFILRLEKNDAKK